MKHPIANWQWKNYEKFRRRLNYPKIDSKMDADPIPCFAWIVSKRPIKPPPSRKRGEMSIAGLDPADFTPVSTKKFGESLRKGAPKPKK